MNNALISILGNSNKPFEMPDSPVELITDGNFYKENGDYVVAYQESELTGLTGTTTYFRIASDKITMERTGDVCSQMVFEKNRKHISLMDTPFGAITIGVCATRVSDCLDDSGGVVNIVYDMEIDRELVGTHSIAINVKGTLS